MKIKKFKNIWAMGLIIFGVILLTLYLLKLIIPEFVIKVAELPAVVRFGEYVDTHQWAYYLFTFIISYITGYVYCCACIRKNLLNYKEMLIVAAEVLLLFIIEKFIPAYYLVLNILFMLVMPVLMCLLSKTQDIKYLYSITICLTVHLIAQIISAEIRNIMAMISYPNSATFTILLIDGFIWLVLLYCFYNFKNRKSKIKEDN